MGESALSLLEGVSQHCFYDNACSEFLAYHILLPGNCTLKPGRKRVAVPAVHIWHARTNKENCEATLILATTLSIANEHYRGIYTHHCNNVSLSALGKILKLLFVIDIGCFQHTVEKTT